MEKNCLYLRHRKHLLGRKAFISLIIVYHEIIMTNLDLIYKHTIKWPWMNDVNYGTLIPIRIILLHRLCDLSIVIQKYIWCQSNNKNKMIYWYFNSCSVDDNICHISIFLYFLVFQIPKMRLGSLLLLICVLMVISDYLSLWHFFGLNNTPEKTFEHSQNIDFGADYISHEKN